MGNKQSARQKCTCHISNKKEIPKGILQKILSLGDENVGKSSILSRYTQGRFYDNISPTYGIDIGIKNVDKYRILDVSGKERYNNILSSYYHNVLTYIIIYDI